MMNLILTNSNILTLDPECPQAEFVVIQDGLISRIGSMRDFGGYSDKNTKVIDCRRKTILPGFIDAHCHLLAFAETFVTLNLEPRFNVRSIADIQSKIQEMSQELTPGSWIRARGYNDFYLREKRHPTRLDLDLASSIHPIRITHRSGRAHVLNSLALKLVGISKDTPDPPEGLIDREIATGEPTGLLYGMGDFLAKAIPPLDSDQMEHGIKLANNELISLGITSLHDASPRNNLERWKMIQRWKQQDLFKPRVNMILGWEGFRESETADYLNQGDGSQLRLGGVKIIIHETTGRLSPDQADLNEKVVNIHRSGLQAVMHAIEEKTMEAACGAIEFALERSPISDHRHRIEHCSVCTGSLAKRLASLGVRVVTQPSFLFYNGDRYLKTVPEQNLNHLYPIATLVNHGVGVVGSSDVPIVPPNPLIGIYAAASRKTESGNLVLPEERIDVLEALRMYTADAAEVAFEERMKGTITPGKLADLVVLDRDPTKVSADEIKSIKVEMTILNGEIVWDNMDPSFNG